MLSRAKKVLEGAALGQEVEADVTFIGSTAVMECDQRLAAGGGGDLAASRDAGRARAVSG